MKTLYTTIIILILSISANAQTNEWISTVPGNWNNPTNWSLGVVPTASHDVDIGHLSSTVTIPSGYFALAKSVFNNTQLIIDLGASLTIDGSATYGLENIDTIINNGIIEISNTASDGIYHIGINASFTNKGSIKCMTGIGRNGIVTFSGDFTNGLGATIEISNTDFSGISNSGITFTNRGIIKCTSNIGTIGITTSGNFINDTNGSIEVSNTVMDGIVNSGANSTFSNKGSIKFLTAIGENGLVNSSAAIFNNQSGGVIEISNTQSFGINNFGSNTSFTNNGSIKTLVGIGYYGIANYASAGFTNDTDGNIELSNTTANGINNSGAGTTFANSGSIKCLVGIGDDGIRNEASADFINNIDAIIELSNTTENGINNYGANTSFTNYGIIKFLAGIGTHGIYNELAASFTNDAGGNIEISNTVNHGINNENAITTFTNKGSVKCLAGIGEDGITNFSAASFINDTGGIIEISNTTDGGIDNYGIGTSFTNKGTIISITGIGSHCIQNSAAATFSNDSGASINILSAAVTGCYSYGINSVFNNRGTINCSSGNKGILNTFAASFNNDVGGIIQISNINGNGVNNDGASTSFVNKGTLKCLDGIGGIGIDNFGSEIFLNDTSGIIEISNTAYGGIQNYSALFINKGSIKSLTGIGGDGIYNWEAASFVNDVGANIEISNTTDDGISNENANTTFTNNGIITCLAGIGTHGIHNSLQASFTNETGATIDIVHATHDGVLNKGANTTFVNNGSLFCYTAIGDDGVHNSLNAEFSNVGTLKCITSIAGDGIQNDSAGVFLNNTGGIIELSATGTHGILNKDTLTTFSNMGTIKTLSSIGADGINNSLAASFINEVGALIELPYTTGDGIDNLGANTVFTNKGTIKCLTSIGDDGIKNAMAATFFNNTGTIEISNTTNRGINNFNTNSSFTNKGTIKCLSAIGRNAVDNSLGASFLNDAGSTLEITDAGYSGIYNVDANTSFVNRGLLKCITDIGEDGIYNGSAASFLNESLGFIDLASTTDDGIDNTGTGTSFVNEGIIRCLAAIGDDGICISLSANFTNNPQGEIEISNTTGNGINRIGGNFLNEFCGIIFINEKITDQGAGDFINLGYIYQNYSSANISSIINDGVIEDLHGSFPTSGISNQGYIVAPLNGTIIENQPVMDALKGNGALHTILNNQWYTDVNLTISAGSYDPTANIWTPNSNAVGLSRFFIRFFNGTCAALMEINLDNPVRCAGTLVTWNGSSSNLWDDPDNWIPAGIPGPCSNIEIGSGHEILIQNGTTAEVLSLKNSGNLIIEGYLHLFLSNDKPALYNLNGNITNDGVILIHNVTGINPLSKGILNLAEGGSTTIVNNGTIEVDQISKEGFYNTGSAVFIQNGVCRITNAGTIPFNNAVNAVVKGSSPIELIGGGVFFNLANVNPGNSPGQLTIDGIYDCDVAAVTTIEIAGTDGVGSPDGHDQLVVGEAELNGTLDVSLLNGYVPDFGESFIIMTSPSGNINGTFSSVIHTPPTYWDVNYQPNYVEVTAVEFLPVELLSFNVRLIDNIVEIKWSTASEKNNDYFTVERSIYGKDWTELRIVEGSYNSNQIHRYNTIDEHPLTGLSYYRLKQTDFDGSFTYSSIKSITIGLCTDDLRIYPNPTIGKITIEGKDIHTYQIFDSTGREMKDITPYINQGETQRIIDLSGILPGMYFIKTETTVVRVQKL